MAKTGPTKGSARKRKELLRIKGRKGGEKTSEKSNTIILKR